MLSITQPFTTFHSKVLPTSQHHRHVESSTFFISTKINTTSSNNNNGTSNDEKNAAAASPAPPAITPPNTVEIRFRRGARRRRKGREDGVDGGGRMAMSSQASSPPKDWESMTLTEKAIELYMGEKGLLFWLNKFAYASIFIIIGAWILFRFVGPALNLYQLDTPPLSPTSMFKDS